MRARHAHSPPRPPAGRLQRRKHRFASLDPRGRRIPRTPKPAAGRRPRPLSVLLYSRSLQQHAGWRPRPWWEWEWGWGKGKGLRALDCESILHRGSSGRDPRAARVSYPFPEFHVSVGQVLAEIRDLLPPARICLTLAPLGGRRKQETDYYVLDAFAFLVYTIVLTSLQIRLAVFFLQIA